MSGRGKSRRTLELVAAAKVILDARRWRGGGDGV